MPVEERNDNFSGCSVNKNRGIKPSLLNFQILPIQFPQRVGLVLAKYKPGEESRRPDYGKIAMAIYKACTLFIYRSINYSLKSQIQLLGLCSPQLSMVFKFLMDANWMHHRILMEWVWVNAEL